MLLSNPPGISRYRGEGPLAALLYFIAVRVELETAAIKPLRDDALLELAAAETGFEESKSRGTSADERFGRRSKSLALSPGRGKVLLQFHVVDGLNIDAIGAIYGAHRATVARWLVAIRTRVFANLKERFALKWKMSTSELRSLTKVMRNYVHLSAARVLSGSR